MALAALIIASFGDTPRIIAAYGDARTLDLYNIHNGETLTVLYKKDGQYVPDALKKLNWFFRDWRKNEQTNMDPRVFDIAWELHEELGSQKPIHVVSGYRSPGTNEKLRRAGGGQAKSSQHILGHAIDLHFPDVPTKSIRYAALIRERGGVGYYPTSALPFVHVDVGRVRMWPRMPRQELALLFPNGRSKYVPADGRPISIADVGIARAKYVQLAADIDRFHHFRSEPHASVLVASADAQVVPPKPELARPELARNVIASVGDGDSGNASDGAAGDGVSLSSWTVASLGGPVPTPKLASRVVLASQQKLKQQAREKAQLVRLASADPTMIVPVPAVAERPANDPYLNESGWAKAPEYDGDDHPGELSYRPFEIGQFLVAKPTIDDESLSHMVHPVLAIARTMIGDAPEDVSFRFKPELRYDLASLDDFAADDVNAALFADPDPGKLGPSKASGVPVKTAATN